MNIETSSHKPQISWPDTANVSDVSGVPRDEIAEFVAKHFGNTLSSYFGWRVEYFVVPEMGGMEIASVVLYKD